MTTAIHETAPEEIMAFQDGELTADRARQVFAHLASCAECQNLAESLRSTSQSLEVWAIKDAPARLQPRMATASSLTSTVDLVGFAAFWHKLRSRHLALTWGTLASLLVLALLGITATKPYYRARPSMTVDKASVNTAAADRDISRLPGNSRAPLAEKFTRNPGNESLHQRLEMDGLSSAVENNAQQVVRSSAPALPVASQTGEETARIPMIARTAVLQIVASRFDAARAAVESILPRHHGYAASLNVADAENNARTLNASLRIPSHELPAAMTELKALGHVANESQAGEEVTAEHADLVARLKNSRETETRLQDILRTRTGKVSDVLEVEQEIARVRGEIEQMESELKTLDHRVAFATITLSISEEYKAKVGDSTPGIRTRFHNAAVAGYENVTASALGLALWFTEYLPPILFWMVLLVAPVALFWRWRRRVIASTTSPLA